MTSLMEGRNYTSLKKEILRTVDGRVQVDVNSSSAGGDASATNQSTMIAHLGQIETAVEGTLTVDGSTVTQPVSAASLPLPSGAATSANQTTSNASLSSIDSALSGTLNVAKSSTTNINPSPNLASNVSLAASGDTTVVDCSNITVGNLFYEDSSTSSYDSLDIMVSPDGTNYYYYSSLFPYTNGSGLVRRASYFELHLEGITHIKLTNTSTLAYANVTSTLVGSP